MKNNLKEKYYIGIDLGGTTTKIAIIDKDGKILEFVQNNTDISEDGKNILKDIAEKVDEIIEKFGVNKKDIAGIGVGIPGPVDEYGNVKFAVNLGWKSEFNITEKLEELTGIRVKAANDATLAILGENWKGSAKNSQNAVMLTLGTGVGGGILINGKIIYGVNGEAGEFGHISVCNKDVKAKCKCGKTGCLEQYASATGIVRLAKEKINDKEIKNSFIENIDDITAKEIWEYVKEKKEFAMEIANIFGEKMAKAIDTISKINNPEIIIIGGGMAEAGEIILEYINKNYNEKYKSTFSKPKIILAELGNKAGILGAAKIIMEN